ncbi:TetR/AcrR family transcriptional regulator [Pseudonocardia kujensis]|uniref:TetR/AcrR family transcriptional regulator n=1 Tax=Pseudonocardia kujensis TaxID=1128675 RepID=UPI001E2B27E0|nr:TetR/AcrR family transcriptional regulator [Pseudonocardia kujensis]MCE0765090.1 TetR/AcrR family transcriptional regulator [Pseudonocardia kujensis]
MALESSGETTLQAIAKAAGVGQGTLYRHFPTRESLLLEVYEEDFSQLVNAAQGLIDGFRPSVALRRWLDELAVFGRKKRALAEVLEAATREELHSEHYDRILAAIESLLKAGVDGGEIRQDVRADELLPLVSFLWHLDTRQHARIPHLLDIVMDGLTASRPHQQAAPCRDVHHE